MVLKPGVSPPTVRCHQLVLSKIWRRIACKRDSIGRALCFQWVCVRDGAKGPLPHLEEIPVDNTAALLLWQYLFPRI